MIWRLSASPSSVVINGFLEIFLKSVLVAEKQKQLVSTLQFVLKIENIYLTNEDDWNRPSINSFQFWKPFREDVVERVSIWNVVA